MLMELKKGYFSGLIHDVLDARGFKVAEIINKEMMDEKLDMHPEDYIVSLKISANQGQLDQFAETFTMILSKVDKPSERGAQEMGSLISIFDSDEHKSKAIGLAITL